MADFIDMMVASDLAASQTMNQMRVESAHQRAKNIEDNFGIKAQSLEEYRKEHGGSGWLKAIAWTAAGVAAGALLLPMIGALGFTLGAGALVGGVVGALVGSFSMSRQSKRVESGYSDYLDQVSAQGRAGRSMSRTVEYDNDVGGASFAAKIAAERQRAQTSQR